MERTWPLLTAFSVAYAFFITAPSFLHQEFPLRSDMEWGDALDIATPLVVFAFVWLLVQRTLEDVDTPAVLLLLAIALIWSQGQGMHLASNSISHEVPEGASGALPGLVHFYDERLSHYIWYAAVVALPAYFLFVMWRRQPETSSQRPPLAVAPAALLFGLVLGISSIEAAVVPLALSVFMASSALAVYLYKTSARLRGVELFAFTGASSLVAVALLLAWGAYYQGWPEPSDVGLI
jgi:hypothetical protein